MTQLKLQLPGETLLKFIRIDTCVAETTYLGFNGQCILLKVLFGSDRVANILTLSSLMRLEYLFEFVLIPYFFTTE